MLHLFSHPENNDRNLRGAVFAKEIAGFLLLMNQTLTDVPEHPINYVGPWQLLAPAFICTDTRLKPHEKLLWIGVVGIYTEDVTVWEDDPLLQVFIGAPYKEVRKGLDRLVELKLLVPTKEGVRFYYKPNVSPFSSIKAYREWIQVTL